MLAASHRVRWRSVFRLSPAPTVGLRRYAGLDFLKNALVPFPIDFVGDVPKADENLIGGFRDAGNMIAVRHKFVQIVPVSTETIAPTPAPHLWDPGDTAVTVPNLRA